MLILFVLLSWLQSIRIERRFHTLETSIHTRNHNAKYSAIPNINPIHYNNTNDE